MKKIITIITVLIFVNCSTEKKQVQSQSFNTEAISKFWEITAYLKRDHALNDALWNSYYNLKGNKNYIENNRSKENAIDHRKFLELVFRPSLNDSLQRVIRSKKLKNNDIFQNLIYIKNNEKVLNEYTKTITSTAYFKECITLSKKFLPKGKYQEIPKNLVIYIQAFTYDAAVQDSSMYFGLSVVHDFDKLKKGAVAAHELHHALRKNKELKNKLSVRDSVSYTIVNQINNEGIADLIDKEPLVEYPNKTLMGSMFKDWLLGNAKNVVTKIDTSFTLNAKNDKNFIDKKDFRKITMYSSGHIPGFYMVKIIKRNGYLQELIDGSDNPFNFFYLYNKAAKKDKTKPIILSETTMKYLRQLEKKAYD